MTSALRRLLQVAQKTSEEPSYTLSEVSTHCDWNDCWIVVCDYVYDVTSFIDQHPGGRDVLMEYAGRDATVAFFGAGHHPQTMDLLTTFRIGTLAQHERINLIGSLSGAQNLWPKDRVNVAVAD